MVIQHLDRLVRTNSYYELSVCPSRKPEPPVPICLKHCVRLAVPEIYPPVSWADVRSPWSCVSLLCLVLVGSSLIYRFGLRTVFRVTNPGPSSCPWVPAKRPIMQESAFDQACLCGRSFQHAAAFKNHQNACKKNKTRLSLALAKAKEVIASRKRRAAAAPSHAGDEVQPDLEFSGAEVRESIMHSIPSCSINSLPGPSIHRNRCRVRHFKTYQALQEITRTHSGPQCPDAR